MPAPTDRHGVMRLLGLATYIGAKYCPNYSEMTGASEEDADVTTSTALL